MTFKCDLCNYESDDKSNYNRHMKSKAHAKLVTKADSLALKANFLVCIDCGEKFAHASSLSRHKNNTCKKVCIDDNKVCIDDNKVCIDDDDLEDNKGGSSDDWVDELKIDELNIDEEIKKQIKINILRKQLNDSAKQLNNKNKQLNDKNKQLNDNAKQLNAKDNQIKELTTYIKNTNPTQKTYNISVKNYIQQNYPEAPPLIKVDTYKLLKEKEEKKDNESDFGQILAYYYNSKQLYSYLGDFLVSQYRKKDPANQSIWNTDVARLTYFIKDLLANKKKSCWNRDPKGLKTKSYIIDPFLKYITDYCDAYIDAHAIARNKLKDVEFCYKTTETLTALGNIMFDICNGIIAEDIVKYIAPHFQMDNKQQNINFIDDAEDVIFTK
jgi:X-X-X-Leu-X-X-Gly heptad repeat protein